MAETELAPFHTYKLHPAFGEWDEFDIKTTSPLVASGVLIHGVHKRHADANKQALLLVHGAPQNLNIWYKMAPLFAKDYHVVACDLRGYGSSTKPPRGDKDEVYSKRELANDLVQVMSQLGYKKFLVVGHDRGARVTHRLLLDYPSLVASAVLLDIAPTTYMYANGGWAFAKFYWHWFLFIQPWPIPEITLSTKTGQLISMMIKKGLPDQFVDPHALESYVSSYSPPQAWPKGTISSADAMISDYRASAPTTGIDALHSQENEEKGEKIKARLLVFWGSDGIIGKLFDPVKAWTDACDPGKFVEGIEVPNCGHYVPEQADTQWIHSKIESFFQAGAK